MEKLKPCPFCGGEAEIVKGRYANGTIVYKVRCANVTDCKVLPETIFGEKEKAIAAWNRRVKSDV